MNRKKFLKLGVLAAILAPITKAFSNLTPVPKPNKNGRIYICVNGEVVPVDSSDGRLIWACHNGQNMSLATYFEHHRHQT